MLIIGFILGESLCNSGEVDALVDCRKRRVGTGTFS